MQADLLSKIENLLEMESDIYKSLRNMVSLELEAIMLDRDMEELLKILQQKQEVISRLQLLLDSWIDTLPMLGLDHTRGSEGFWDKLAAFFSQEQAELLQIRLTETRAAAEDLMEAEKSVQAELEKHVQQLREKMLAMNQGRSAFIGYAKMGGGTLNDSRI